MMLLHPCRRCRLCHVEVLSFLWREERFLYSIKIEKMSDTVDTGDTYLWFPAADIHQSNSVKSYRESSPSELAEVSQP
jgi:hypothetical protein